MTDRLRRTCVDLGRSRAGVGDLGGRTLVIVRHAQCEAPGKASTAIDVVDSPLTVLGLEQADAVGRALAGLEPIVVLSSPMKRALQTAAAVAREACAPVHCWQDLKEVHPHCFDVERTHAQLAEIAGRPVTFDWTDRAGWNHGDNGYESMRRRANGVLERLAAEFPAPSCVAVVTHGGFANYLLGAAIGLREHQSTWFQLDHAGVSILRFPAHPELERPGWEMFPPVAVEVLSLNDLGHLAPALRSCDG